MKLSEVIDILAILPYHLDEELNPDFKEALKVGIEALKRFYAFRRKGRIFDISFLPGETEE